MLLLPFDWQGNLKLLVVLEQDNVERIKSHDCADVRWKDLMPNYSHLPVDCVTIGYVNPEEAKQLYSWARGGEIAKCIELVTKGFKYRPEAGDHDFGSVQIKPTD